MQPKGEGGGGKRRGSNNSIIKGGRKEKRPPRVTRPGNGGVRFCLGGRHDKGSVKKGRAEIQKILSNGGDAFRPKTKQPTSVTDTVRAPKPADW